MISTNEIIKVLKELSREKNLRVTIKESIKGGLIAGGCATIGGVLIGPAGIAIGGAVGGIVGAIASQGRFVSVYQVLAEMDPTQQAKLAEKVRNIIQSVDATDAVALTSVLAGNATLKENVTAILVDFLRTEMSMPVE